MAGLPNRSAVVWTRKPVIAGILSILSGAFMVWPIFPPHPWGDLIWTPVLSILAVALVGFAQERVQPKLI